MEDASKIKEFLRKTLLDSYRDEYKEISDIWRGLETKAQGNIAIAGIFIAGAFAFISKIDQQTSRLEKGFLISALVFLVASVIFSVLVLRVRQVYFPPMGGFIDQMFIDHLKITIDTELFDRLPRFINDQAKAWRKVKTNTEAQNKLKARYLGFAQWFLLIAILTIASATLIKIIQLNSSDERSNKNEVRVFQLQRSS